MITRNMLSDEQETALRHMLSFTESNDRSMVLTGYAGTGKSTLLNIYLNEMEKDNRDVICTAPTNEAVRVISMITGKQYDRTIYSLLGLAYVEIDDQEGKVVKQRKSTISKYDVIIIDEASMISKDLYECIVNEMKEDRRIKIIFVGDIAQLSPVGDDHESPVFQLQNKASLVQVQRVAQDNPIIEVVTNIRNNLSCPNDIYERNTLTSEAGEGIIFQDDKYKFMDDLLSKFTSEEYRNNPYHAKVLAFTNKTVNALNSVIRRKIYAGQQLYEYMPNEMLVVDKPVIDDMGNVVMSVGERMRIDNVEFIGTNHPDFKLEEDEKIEDYIPYFRMDVLVFGINDNTKKQIKVIHDTFLPNYYSKLKKLGSKCRADEKKNEKMGYFKQRSKAEIWAPYFKFKSQYAWVKYVYASTVHKAQGSTYEYVYAVDRDFGILRWNHMERNRLKYVAFTRASKVLVVH